MQKTRFAVLFALSTVATAAAPPESHPIPEAVLSEWGQNVGTWVADNSAYREDDDSMDAYAMEWVWGIGNKSLVGRLYGIKDGNETATFWQFREFWHPGEGQIIVVQHAGDGTYGAGASRTTGRGTREMLQTFYDPTNARVYRVGHRSTLTGDELTTRSFDVSDDDVWTDRRTYVWHRRR